ncbi:MAG: hypothetical protein ABIU10_00665 [Sphingomicrobium sp.]
MMLLSSREECRGALDRGLAMSIADRNYYRARADQELAAAGRAANQSIGAIHADLAKLFQAKADGPVEAGEVATLEALLVAAFRADEDNFRRSRQSGRA